MLRMVFEIVMALAVILCLVFLTKMGSMDSKADRDQDDSGDDPK
ncbi:MAG: hypothetical protein ACU841_11510 [Gammaproteobacteria bacterium]